MATDTGTDEHATRHSLHSRQYGKKRRLDFLRVPLGVDAPSQA
jgi:hypothetical protein